MNTETSETSAPKIQDILLRCIVPCSLNPRTYFDPNGIADLVASFESKGFDGNISHLLLREIPQQLAVACADPLAELKGSEKPYRIELTESDGTKKVLQYCDTEDADGRRCRDYTALRRNPVKHPRLDKRVGPKHHGCE